MICVPINIGCCRELGAVAATGHAGGAGDWGGLVGEPGERAVQIKRARPFEGSL